MSRSISRFVTRIVHNALFNGNCPTSQMLRVATTQQNRHLDRGADWLVPGWCFCLGSLGWVAAADQPNAGQTDAAHKERLARAKDEISQMWRRVEEKQRTHGVDMMERPRVRLIDGKISIKIVIPSQADVTALIVDIAQKLSKGGGNGSNNVAVKDGEVKMKVAECGVARILQFEEFVSDGDSDLSVQLFVPIFAMNADTEVEVIKNGPLSNSDLSLLETIFKGACNERAENGFHKKQHYLQQWDGEEDPFYEIERQIQKLFENSPLRTFQDLQFHELPQQQDDGTHSPGENDSTNLIQKLESMGAAVYLPNPTEKIDWGILSGYEEQKRRIEDGLLLPLLHPQVFDSIAKRTRKHFATNRPRGVLFEGPPGTGKTTSARIIASQAAVPLVYVPLEAVMSKFYGESERLLADVFKFADQLGGSIVFFDEIETLATTRGSEMHEATRRVLGVLLREMDGFDTEKKIVVIGATNRKQDLDPALLSRFDATISFGLPDVNCRAKILQQYAKHLSDVDVHRLAEETPKMSGRDIRDVCEAAERSWASKIIRGEVDSAKLPEIDEYLYATKQRHHTLTPILY